MFRVPRTRRRVRGGRRAFTLVEVALVAGIVAVLSAIAMPRVSRFVDKARIVAASHMCLVLQSAVEESYGAEGQYPAALDPQWFSTGRLPGNPFAPNPAQPCEIDASGDPTVAHPAIKYFTPGGAADTAYWYNPVNGMVRARVELRSKPGETLWLYNVVNGCALGAEADVTMQADAQAFITH